MAPLHSLPPLHEERKAPMTGGEKPAAGRQRLNTAGVAASTRQEDHAESVRKDMQSEEQAEEEMSEAGGRQIPQSELGIKANLYSLQMIRVFCGLLIDSWVWDTKSKVVKSQHEVNRKYSAAVEKAGRGHNYGSPLPHRTQDLFAVITHPDNNEHLEKMEEGPRTRLKQFSELVADMGEEDSLKIIGHIRVKGMFVSTTERLEIALKDCPVATEVRVLFKIMGAKQQVGPAPPSALERGLQKSLKKKNRRTKKGRKPMDEDE